VVQIHTNDGAIDLIRLTIRTEQDAAVLRDPESASVLCAATCLVVEFNDGASGTGRAAFQKLLEEGCVSLTSADFEQSLAYRHAPELVAQVGDFKAACRRRKGGMDGVGQSLQDQSTTVDTDREFKPPALKDGLGK
jgi:hypothetical protein